MKRPFIFTLAFIVLLIVVAKLFLSILSSPVDRNDNIQHIFVVEAGEATRSIANRLRDEGLIKNSLVFLFEVKRLGLDGKIQAGDFRLSKQLSTAEIAQELTKGTLDKWVQIIEGWRAEEIAKVLSENVPTYEDTWIPILKENEGYLFPDTYLIPKDADINLVTTILRANFDKKIQSLQSDVGKNGLTLEESIILASIVEREVRFADDRPIVAGILLNRLKLGMALQADATVQYALGFQFAEKDWWKKNLTKADLTVNSPFNTYKFPGLPPKPISNPGLASLKAAFIPNNNDFLYYISDKNGRMHYAKTLEEHNSNIAKYL